MKAKAAASTVFASIWASIIFFFAIALSAYILKTGIDETFNMDLSFYGMFFILFGLVATKNLLFSDTK